MDSYSKSGNRIVPNSFQVPNMFIDDLQALLTLPEFAVLMFADRHILGWQDKIADRTARISISRFQLTGYSIETIYRALDGLEQYGILICVDHDAGMTGKAYRLVDNESLIDWDGLKERKEKLKATNRKRTAKARQGVSGTEGFCRTEGQGVSGTEGQGVSGTEGIKPIVKPIKTQSPRNGGATSKPPIHPAIVAYYKEARPEGKRWQMSSAWQMEVANAVGESTEAINRWQRLVRNWIGRGWNPTNVKGMVEHYNMNDVDLQMRQPQASAALSLPKIRR